MTLGQGFCAPHAIRQVPSPWQEAPAIVQSDSHNPNASIALSVASSELSKAPSEASVAESDDRSSPPSFSSFASGGTLVSGPASLFGGPVPDVPVWQASMAAPPEEASASSRDSAVSRRAMPVIVPEGRPTSECWGAHRHQICRNRRRERPEVRQGRRKERRGDTGMSKTPKTEANGSSAGLGENAEPNPRKPYVRPTLKRLGSVRELTQTTQTNGR